MKKIILDLCGGTGSWSRPYKDIGYDVRLITLPQFDIREAFIRGDGYLMFPMAKEYDETMIINSENVYGILAAPPCTMFSLARTKAKKPRDLREGMETVIACLKIIWECQYKLKNPNTRETTLKFWALENPYAMLKFFLGKPAFTFDPWEFGDGYQKKTALWGKFNEPIKKPIPMTEEMKKLVKTNSYLHKIKFPKFASDRPIAFRFNKDAKSITPAGFAKAFFEANK